MIFRIVLMVCLGWNMSFSQIEIRSKKLEEITIRTQKPLYKKENEVMNIDFINKDFLLKINSPQLIESVQWVPGVRSQVSCNVCNTADIRINGMEGANTLILIDGMPIVSGLGTIYGLFGIPSGMIYRMEVAKGPSLAQFGIEAIGGTINIVTESPNNKNKLYLDLQSNSYGEQNADISFSFLLTPKTRTMLGLHGHYFSTPHDVNKDGFMDKALTKRFSIFNKWNITPNEKNTYQTAYRILYENRSGGEMLFEPKWKGTDSIYGEYIVTSRGEWLGKYTRILSEKNNLEFQLSANWHYQNSFYGISKYEATQAIGFGQIIYNHTFRKHALQAGWSNRFTHYNDNTPATTQASNIYMPGIWLQDQYQIDSNWSALLSSRLDYTTLHGAMFSPRVGAKYLFGHNNQIRLNIGRGHRIVNVFSEDHAALTGGRQVQFLENLRPESSYNLYANYSKHFDIPAGILNVDISAFYNYFSNKIIADYDTDPEKIIYKNLSDYAENFGGTIQLDAQWTNSLKINSSATILQSYWIENREKRDLLYTPKISSSTIIGYTIPKIEIETNLQAIFTGTMRMPILPKDYRPEYSPAYWLFHLNFSKKFINNKLEVYAGIRNILNYLPKTDVIMRPQDPFDKRVEDPILNPNNYTFDPEYNYASMQIRTLLLGIRLKL